MSQEKILSLGCFYDRSFSPEKLEDFSQDLIALCKKHGVTIKGATDISPSQNPYQDYTWDVRGLILGRLR